MSPSNTMSLAAQDGNAAHFCLGRPAVKAACPWVGALWASTAMVMGLKDWAPCWTFAASWNAVVCLPSFWVLKRVSQRERGSTDPAGVESGFFDVIVDFGVISDRPAVLWYTTSYSTFTLLK